MTKLKMSPWPSYKEDEIRAVHDVLLANKVNYWTGQECRSFEKEFSDWVGTKFAVALSNGTVALDVALNAIGVGAEDEVVVTPRTFIATASCVVNAGAIPVFADIDPISGNITAETISKVLNPRTKAIIVVHLAGYPCDMDPIMTLANKHGIKVIEDCAQAHGSRYKGRSVGGIGHVGAWSFCQDKIMTTGGEGGMVTTNDEYLWRAMWSYKDHGKSYEAVYEREHPQGFRWLHESFGTNWRMLEMQAAIGRIQLKRMPDWTASRTNNAVTIWNACRKFPALRVPKFGCDSCSSDCEIRFNSAGCVHAHYKCYVYVKPEALVDGWSRDKIIEEINNLGVACYQGSCSEVYLEKAFDETGWRPEPRLPVAKELGETSLMFLVHPTLTDLEVKKTCEVIKEVMNQASRVF
jgi:dTDP-4-amino-4,6-dideoxygalactose transaminase